MRAANSHGLNSGARRLFSFRGAVLAMVAAALLSWPMLLVSAPIGYFDTPGYVSNGRAGFSLLSKELAPLSPAAGDKADAASEGPREPRAMRSAIYSFYLAAVAALPAGVALAAIVQAAMVMLVLFALLDGWQVAPRALAGAFALAGLLTTLPWMAAYAMPDILGAAIILYYAAIAVRSQELGRGALCVLCAIAAFATASHYGNLGLTAGLALGLVAVCAIIGGLTLRITLLATLPLAAALLLNLSAGMVGMHVVSVVPKRLPILLARSVEDGPAAKYLDAACPDAGYVICPYFSNMPRDVAGFLWSKQGIGRLSAAELDRLRAEEPEILYKAFRAHPWRQVAMFALNTGRQLVQVGTGQMYPLIGGADNLHIGTPADRPALAVFDIVTKVGTALAALALSLALSSGRIGRDASIVLAIVLAGLAVNAMIFGGLSVPVDRYNSRVIWLLAPLALVGWQSARGRGRPSC